ncbi:clathrin heavy chain linker domain-containing protein 1 isoform X2 [Apteryx rowi]|uniref:clathrin heavy chain linker domain-containing protein 1 isoform X2 n=1 Tax=Apteryx rowi TaxID=308060 RepID=UPI000E1D67A6|nr:clathrin heavy chain linker domain-containing protein 1 isoform X2 [Apteryx rowi]XP_025930147.1 clathrin heavy chain linker domain-containing protein 1 isoform X2 [Apteryx rowi]XP_025930148.1 clathrin heavy chain linker domain-containing protein 1 isoform X2 [Apteryx rowi]XP_025930149.1 clathrin heavy chain linker domain-containing protein 1 isoform X2 [Apteryx rowi]XP_025930150.1 clathrin heavy chain linker domain-containing protein 1 isoform X2 [Apteryx rowi]XP_025930151.1 clathrin heavy 
MHLTRRLKVLASEPTILLYYRKRAVEFEDKIKAIEKNSAKIQNLILRIQNVRKVPSKNFDTPGKTVNSAKPIPGLSIEESLNLDALSKHLAQLDRKMLELKKEREIKYIPWKKKMELEQELLCLLALRDTAEAEREKLKLRYTRILLVANVISACAKSAKTITLQDLLSQIVENKNDERALDVHSKVAEDLLEYFERFSELLSSGQYDAAATSAANSSRGILLNEETLRKFEPVGCLQGRNILLLKYFDTLISSSTAAGLPQNSAMTLDAVKCALSEKQLNTVMHWVTQQRYIGTDDSK